MDTILFLYKKKDIEEPFVEAIRQRTSLLIKIGMDVEPYRWFVQRLPHKQARPEITLTGGKELRGWDWINPRYFKERWEVRSRKKEWKRYELLVDTLTVRCCANVEDMLAELLKELERYSEDQSSCQCVYDKAVRSVLLGDNPVAGVWKKMWSAGEFTGYTELQWVQQLMPFAVNHHFIVLGRAGCIPELLQQYADRMKSLRWIMDEAYAGTHSEELEEFAETFYQEQGLAVTMERVQGRCGFEKLQLTCREPASILDFTGEDRISTGWAARGSIWLDMCSSEEKCRRITRRSGEIQYFSLREKWRQTHKKTVFVGTENKGCRLDTMNKNEYNT